MNRQQYSQKLRDPRWQRKRLEIMQRDGFKCTCCGDSMTTLNVNHLQYAGQPWEVDDRYLETLCESCHSWRTCFDQWVKTLATVDIQALVNKGAIQRTAPWIGES